ncbi:MAG: hypothetical protein ICV62_09870 [Cyanobacteria bacterium Co-bin13]|nr:hypothetical protein [Cyanobacteria bacterium Co-bin13]
MDSRDWAQYIEATDSLSKPWMLVQWRLQLLKERRSEMEPEAFQAALEELHQDLMNLGEWWVGQEEVFGLGNDYRGDR